MSDLMETVVTGLEKRKGEWPKIAAELKPNVSYSMISKLGRRKYDSDPSHKKLRLIAEYLIRTAA